MYFVTEKTRRYVSIRKDKDFRIFPADCFAKAGCKEKTGGISNRIVVTIDGQSFAFSQKEWREGREEALKRFCKGLSSVKRAEIKEIIKSSKKLAPMRAARLRMAANQDGTQKQHRS